jgi:hypothetical protein
MTNINGHEVVNVNALVLKVSLKVGLGLGGTRPPPFLKKICVPCRPRPIQEEMWDALILLKKNIYSAQRKWENNKFSLLPFGKDGQLSEKKIHYCLKNRFFIV